jgi:hypothetical protein
MVSQTLKAAVDALSADERRELLTYLELTVDVDDIVVAERDIAVWRQRRAELENGTSVAVSGDEFRTRLRARWA